VAPSVEAFLRASTERREEDPYSVFRAGRTEIELPDDIVRAIRSDARSNELLHEAETCCIDEVGGA
jgi:hypothetical protein